MKTIYIVKCGNCGRENELLNDYVFYFRQYQKEEPKAVLTCNCGVPIELGEIGKERYGSK